MLESPLYLDSSWSRSAFLTAEWEASICGMTLYQGGGDMGSKRMTLLMGT